VDQQGDRDDTVDGGSGVTEPRRGHHRQSLPGQGGSPRSGEPS
jgi:hypothetical protein